MPIKVDNDPINGLRSIGKVAIYGFRMVGKLGRLVDHPPKISASASLVFAIGNNSLQASYSMGSHLRLETKYSLGIQFISSEFSNLLSMSSVQSRSELFGEGTGAAEMMDISSDNPTASPMVDLIDAE